MANEMKFEVGKTYRLDTYGHDYREKFHFYKVTNRGNVYLTVTRLYKNGNVGDKERFKIRDNGTSEYLKGLLISIPHTGTLYAKDVVTVADNDEDAIEDYAVTVEAQAEAVKAEIRNASREQAKAQWIETFTNFINAVPDDGNLFEVIFSVTYADGEVHNSSRTFDYFEHARKFAVDFKNLAADELLNHSVTIKRRGHLGHVFYYFNTEHMDRNFYNLNEPVNADDDDTDAFDLLPEVSELNDVDEPETDAQPVNEPEPDDYIVSIEAQDAAVNAEIGHAAANHIADQYDQATQFADKLICIDGLSREQADAVIVEAFSKNGNSEATKALVDKFKAANFNEAQEVAQRIEEIIDDEPEPATVEPAEETESFMTIFVTNYLDADDCAELLAELEHEIEWLPSITSYRVDAEQGIYVTCPIRFNDGIAAAEKLFGSYGLNYRHYIFEAKKYVDPAPEIEDDDEPETTPEPQGFIFTKSYTLQDEAVTETCHCDKIGDGDKNFDDSVYREMAFFEGACDSTDRIMTGWKIETSAGNLIAEGKTPDDFKKFYARYTNALEPTEPETTPDVNENFLRARKVIRESEINGRHYWHAIDCLGEFSRINKPTAIAILKEFGLTIDAFRAEEEKFITAAMIRGAAQLAAEEKAEHVRAKVARESKPIDDRDDVFNLLPEIDDDEPDHASVTTEVDTPDLTKLPEFDYSDPVIAEIMAELATLPVDPNADNLRAAEFSTYASAIEVGKVSYCIRSTDFNRAEKALDIFKTKLADRADEYRFGIDRYNYELDGEPVYHMPETDGSEEDEDTDNVFSLLPTLDELNDVILVEGLNGEEFTPARYTDRDDRFNRGERYAEALTAKLRAFEPTVKVTYDINEYDEDTYYLEYGGYSDDGERWGIIPSPFALDGIEDAFHHFYRDKVGYPDKPEGDEPESTEPVNEPNGDKPAFTAPRNVKAIIDNVHKAFANAVDKSKHYGGYESVTIAGETISFCDGKLDSVHSPHFEGELNITNAGRKVFYYRGNSVSKKNFFERIAEMDAIKAQLAAVEEFRIAHDGQTDSPGKIFPAPFVAKIFAVAKCGEQSRQADFLKTFETFTDAKKLVDDFKAFAGDMTFLASIKRDHICGEEVYRRNYHGDEVINIDELDKPVETKAALREKAEKLGGTKERLREELSFATCARDKIKFAQAWMRAAISKSGSAQAYEESTALSGAAIAKLDERIAELTVELSAAESATKTLDEQVA